MNTLSRSLIVAAVAGLQAASLFAETRTEFPPVNPEFAPRIDAALPAEAPAKPRSPRKVLIFSRTEGYVHNAISSGIYAFKKLGERTGAYTSDSAGDMEVFTPDSLAQYDAIIFNNTTQLKFENPAHRAALLDFVRQGKGLIGIHSATDNFPDWEEGRALIGGKFNGHPWNADDLVAIKLDDPKNVINKPFDGKGFWIKDEIYQMDVPYSRDKVHVLNSLDMSKEQNARSADKISRKDGDFAIGWIKNEGKGRVFYSSLGHNDEVFWTPQILAHYLAGIQFALGDLEADAALGQKLTPALAPADPITLGELAKSLWLLSPDAMTFIKSYKAGTNDDTMVQWRNNVRFLSDADRAQLEKNIVKAGLAGEISADSKVLIAKTLVGIGTDESIPLLVQWAKNGDGQIAVYALAALQSKAADTALAGLLAGADDNLKVAILSALSRTKSPIAVKDASSFLSGSAPVAAAALSYLGHVASPEAIQALQSAKVAADVAVKRDWTLVAVADNEIANGRAPQAAAILTAVLKSQTTDPVRVGAAQAILRAQGADAVKTTLLPLLKTGDENLRDILAGAIVRYDSEGKLGGVPAALASVFSTLPEDVQLSIISNVIRKPRPELLGLAQAGVKGSDPVKLASLNALALCGNETVLSTLVDALPNGATAGVAAESIAKLNGKGVTEAIRKQISSNKPAEQITYIKIAALRADFGALPLVIKETKSKDPEVRKEAFSALVNLAQAQDLAMIVELQAAAETGPEKSAWREAVVKAAKSRVGDASAVAVVQPLLAKAQGADRGFAASLLGTLDQAEASAALTAYLNSLDEEGRKDVIRGLSNVRNLSVMAILQNVATNGQTPTEKILAFRGYLDSIRELEMQPNEKLKLYETAWSLASRPEDKEAVLAALDNIHNREAEELLQKLKSSASQ